VFIGEQTLAPIPAFCTGPQGAIDAGAETDAPLNWVLGQVPWDTSTLDPAPLTDTTWKFWVVVWVEDSAGDLEREIPEHGPAGIPLQDLDSLAEVQKKTYCTNVGFYNQVFTLKLPTSTAAESPGPSATEQ
jgi:hypothetical protein